MDFRRNNLCFDEKLFMQENFSVDEFLTKHRRKANLETLRDDLGVFLKNLRSSTIELINRDYADFVDLSANLVSLNQSIVGVEIPVTTIKDEITRSKTILDEKIAKITDLINRRKLIRKQMQSIKSVIKVETSLERIEVLLQEISNNEDYNANILSLERIVNEINQYHFHSKQCDGFLNRNVLRDFEKSHEQFLAYLKDIFLVAIKHEKKGLVNCLRLYFSLNQINLAHEIVRKEIVSPYFYKMINEEALRNEPSGLEGLFSKILNFIDTDLKYILQLTQLVSKDVPVKGFDFMVHSVWPELEERLEFNLKSIYSQGNADSFFKCYTITLSFLDKFEERCLSLKSVTTLRSTIYYKNFLQCWNLTFYYTMRFQELAGKLERIIHSSKNVGLNESDNDWKLLISSEVWNCLLRCWQEDIFIRQLAHRFWKFNLQIISRYTVWMSKIIEQKSINQLPTSRINFLIFLHTDSSNLVQRFPVIYNLARDRIGSGVSTEISENMQKCLEENKQNILLVQNTIEKKIIDIISEKNASVMRQVSEIPRLYRRTNRNTPTQPCSYVASLLAPVYELQKVHGEYVTRWFPPILSTVTAMYHEQVFEVLTSVQRTEESLRKFKKIRDPSNMDSKQNTDDDKIRLQLQIDIQHYSDAVNNLVTGAEINKMNELNDILKSLKRN
ncbi:conserved oligomeric Golgi complex subunit 2 [Planococcus citri]|uniref:conserved oligomeric Golgi complex subunit 2 n=1 Tax=Planococcus citri TaxID=170843 RepID=UPI0031F84F2A